MFPEFSSEESQVRQFQPSHAKGGLRIGRLKTGNPAKSIKPPVALTLELSCSYFPKKLHELS